MQIVTHSAMRLVKRRNSVLGLFGVVFGFFSIIALVRKQKYVNISVQPSQRILNSYYSPTLGKTTCVPATKIAFVKVHKAGSSTVANILQRFGYTRNLNFVIPRKRLHEFGYNYIGRRGDTVSRGNILPPPTGESFDILWNHVTYDHDAFREVMPRETRYISIIREPFDQFVSAFEYYNLGFNRSKMPYYRNPMAEFLNREKAGYPSRFQKYYRVLNSQSYDLGFNETDFRNASYRVEQLSRLSRDFDLVMLMEYFDESMVLLKRIMCWSLQDILYIPMNKNKWKIRRRFDQDSYDTHRQLSAADYDLYDHFRKIFWDKIWNEGPDFFEEVRYFKSILAKLWDYCSVGRVLVVPSSRWGNSFIVSRQTCLYIQYSELRFYDKIVKETSMKTLSNLPFSEFNNEMHINPRIMPSDKYSR